VFEDRVLRVFGPKGDEVTRGWRKLNNEELHNLYSSAIIISMFKEDDVGRECSTHMKTRDAWRILVGKPEGKRPVERPRLR
jgi:hypothetical protein